MKLLIIKVECVKTSLVLLPPYTLLRSQVRSNTDKGFCGLNFSIEIGFPMTLNREHVQKKSAGNLMSSAGGFQRHMMILPCSENN